MNKQDKMIKRKKIERNQNQPENKYSNHKNMRQELHLFKVNKLRQA